MVSTHFEKYARQIGSFHQTFGVKIPKKCLKPPPSQSFFLKNTPPPRTVLRFYPPQNPRFFQDGRLILFINIYIYMDVSKNRGILPPKWMVKIHGSKPYEQLG